jgi:hypothetical protein
MTRLALIAALLMPGVAWGQSPGPATPTGRVLMPGAVRTYEYGETVGSGHPTYPIPPVGWLQGQSSIGIFSAATPESSTITISDCCTIHQSGRVDLAEGVKLDDASRAFWTAVSQFGMQNCRPIEGAKP